VEHSGSAFVHADEERALRGQGGRGAGIPDYRHLGEQKASQISVRQKKLLELGRTMMVDFKIVFLGDERRRGVKPHAAEHYRRRDHPSIEQGTRPIRSS